LGPERAEGVSIIARGAAPGRALLNAARALGCDRVSAEVVGAFQGAGIPSILLKGPSIAQWLYPSGGRSYLDTDLLVPAFEFSRAGAVLKSLGFLELLEGFHSFERSLDPGAETAFVRRPGLGGGGGEFVDLHRNLPRLSTPDEFLWEAFSAGTEMILVSDIKVCVLGRTALALHVVLHAVQHRFQYHTSEDLRRAIAMMSADDWRPVADLAARLGVTGVMGFGLRHDAVGAEIAEGLGLPGLSSTDPLVKALHAPRGSVSLADFWSDPTLRAKVQRIRWMLLPSPAKIRYVSRLPDAHGRTLLLAYVRWWRDLAPAFVSAVRFVRGQPKARRGQG
jgi:hypothetical protein